MSFVAFSFNLIFIFNIFIKITPNNYDDIYGIIFFYYYNFISSIVIVKKILIFILLKRYSKPPN